MIAATRFGGAGGSSGGGAGIPQEDIDAAFAALADKGVTVPDGATSADLDELIASIVTGGGGGVTVQTGSVTFASQQSSYAFIAESPDIFVFFSTPEQSIEYSSANYVWGQIQYKELVFYTYGYNRGSSKYYTPDISNPSVTGEFRSGSFNGRLGATTYKWIAIWGVE